MSNTMKGWLMLSAGALMISGAAGIAWGVPVAIGVAGAWTIAYGIALMVD